MKEEITASQWTDIMTEKYLSLRASLEWEKSCHSCLKFCHLLHWLCELPIFSQGCPSLSTWANTVFQPNFLRSWCFSSVSRENSSLALSRGCSGLVLASRKLLELSSQKYSSGNPGQQQGGSKLCFWRQEWALSGEKNKRAEEMIILLLDANKTVNGVITGTFFQLPCDQQWQQIQSFQLAYYLGGAFPGWCPPGLWGSQERGCASLNTHRIKAAGYWEHGQWERWLNPVLGSQIWPPMKYWG